MRHFTPEEANAELEHVRPLVEQLVASRQEHAAALERQEELERKIRGNGGGIPPAELAQATAEVDAVARRLARLVDEITSHGAQVKDLDSGLIDFPALHHGETVLLCWQLGEDEIALVAPRGRRLRRPPPAAARLRIRALAANPGGGWPSGSTSSSRRSIFVVVTLVAPRGRLVAAAAAAAAGGRDALSRLPPRSDRRHPRRRSLLGPARDSRGARGGRRAARVVGAPRRRPRLRRAADARQLHRRAS